MTLAADSPVVEKTISERRSPARPRSSRSCARSTSWSRAARAVFEAGDEVLALVTPDSEDEIRELLTGSAD